MRLFLIYEENIGVLTPFIAESIALWLEEVSAEVVLLAVRNTLSIILEKLQLGDRTQLAIYYLKKCDSESVLERGISYGDH